MLLIFITNVLISYQNYVQRIKWGLGYYDKMYDSIQNFKIQRLKI